MQNRNKLVDLFIGNISNSITHKILEIAIENVTIISKYQKESKISFDIAKKYREKINPVNKTLPTHDTNNVRRKIINKVRAELNLRISRGYTNIDLSLVEKFVDSSLKELGVV